MILFIIREKTNPHVSIDHLTNLNFNVLKSGYHPSAVYISTILTIHKIIK